MHTIRYRLSPIGQKASLLAGSDGKILQVIEVQPGSEEFKALLGAARVNLSSDGQATLDLSCTYYGGATLGDQDAPLDAAGILALWQQRQQEHAEEEAQRDAEIRRENQRREESDAAALATFAALPLAERVDASGNLRNLPSVYNYTLRDKHPAFLEACAERDRIAAERKAREKADEEEKERKRLQWREKMGLEDDEISLKIEDGRLAAVPSGCWESHRRGKNWFATITTDPRSPGGLARDFHTKARGDLYYLLPDLNPGDAVEFGANYYSGGGRKNPTRWYGFVVRIAPPVVGISESSYLVLCKCGTGKQACKQGAAYAKDHPGRLAPEDAVDQGIARVNGEGAIVTPSEN